MKKYLFAILSALLTSGFAFAQTNVTPKLTTEFVKVSEQREPGKVFYVVDMSYFSNDNQKSAFLELVYTSQKVFAVSVVKEDNTFLVCGFESVISTPDALTLIDTYRQQALVPNGQANSIDKHKAK